MVCGPSGLTATSPLYSVGIQYADRSPRALHVVAPAVSESTVVFAFVVVLPMNVCMCDAPASPGNTIGSSGRLPRLTEQLAWNSWKPPLFGGTSCEGFTFVTGFGAMIQPAWAVAVDVGVAPPVGTGPALDGPPVTGPTVAVAGAPELPNTCSSHSE